MTRVAIDTGALLALASSRDQYHERAVAAEARHRKSGGRFVGSTLVLAELHSHLLRRSESTKARGVIVGLMRDPGFEWHDAGVELVQRAIEQWIDRFSDQRFSLTDAVTFELMRRNRIARAFAFDADFETAGFELLD